MLKIIGAVCRMCWHTADERDNSDDLEVAEARCAMMIASTQNKSRHFDRFVQR